MRKPGLKPAKEDSRYFLSSFSGDSGPLPPALETGFTLVPGSKKAGLAASPWKLSRLVSRGLTLVCLSSGLIMFLALSLSPRLLLNTILYAPSLSAFYYTPRLEGGLGCCTFAEFKLLI